MALVEVMRARIPFPARRRAGGVTGRAGSTLVGGRGALGVLDVEGQALAILGAADFDGVAIVDVAAQEVFGERVFHEAFDGAAHRARAVGGVVALRDDDLAGFRREFERDAFGS